MTSPPLIDRDVDLRDFPFMPIEITRLLGSDFNAIGDDTAWRVGMVLWLRSYHQVPAGSLPSDDAAIMRLAELGKDTKTWKRIKADALRGWVHCDDGRLYHPVVCEKALEGWIEKLAQRKASEAGNAKRYGFAFDPSSVDAAMERAKSQLLTLNPRSRALNKKGKRYAPGAPNGSSEGDIKPPDGSPDRTMFTPHSGCQEKRQGQGRETHISLSAAGGGSGASDEALRAFFASFPIEAEVDGVRRELGRRLAQGVPLSDIVEGAKRYTIECKGRSRQHIGSPVRWLVDGRWRDGRPKEDAVLPIVSQGTPQGDAWEKHMGRSNIWHNGRRTVPTEWPPGGDQTSGAAA